MEVSEKEIGLVREILGRQIGPGGVGLLTTASADGVPHTTWMGTMAAPRWDQITTITSPDSRKVANIRENPRVEWLFNSENLAELVYLEGTAEVVSDPVEIKRYWNAIPDKNRAFFLLYFNSELGFCVLRTRIETVCLCVPDENRTVRFPPERLREG